jgi:hypothetical protein
VSTDRRQFVQQVILGGAALAAVPALAHAETPGVTPPSGDVSLPMLMDQPPAPSFDTSWTSRLTGKYKAVFDVPEIHGGSGVWRAGLWRNHYTDVLKSQPADLSSVIVIRHLAIPLIMSHEFWDTYDLAKANKVRHPMTEKKTRRNPVLMTVADDALPEMFGKLTLPEQMARGSVVLACGMAFAGMTSLVMKREKLSMADARAKAMSMVVPGVIMQPNGIFGVTLAQHHGCVFVAAS